MQLSEGVKKVLLTTARDSIKTFFEGSIVQAIDFTKYPELLIKNVGAFVTLTKHSQLKGCIGYLEYTGMTLFDTICQAARHAAFEDPRFRPLSKNELKDIEIEISVLSTFSPINDYEEIIVGTHGLLLDEDRTRALLLPQVATENNFTLQEFLAAICQKAGIDSHTWEKRKLKLKVFTATVFSEKEYHKENYEST
jgi:AmmeMemoRadiSam system protein A